MLFLLAFILPVVVTAQDCTPLDPTFPDCLDPDSPVPIDDGVIVLLIAGVLAGVFYIRNQQTSSLSDRKKL